MRSKQNFIRFCAPYAGAMVMPIGVQNPVCVNVFKHMHPPQTGISAQSESKSHVMMPTPPNRLEKV